MPTAIAFWFDFASIYSYIAALRIERLAADAGLSVEWRPFLLGPLFTEQQGFKDSPFNVYPIRGRYAWRDLERLAAKYRLPWRKPSVFPRNSILSSRVALLGAREPWGGAFVRAVYKANFAHDRDISDPAVLSELLQGLGQDAAARIAQAQEAGTKQALRDQTAEASRLGFFGAPNFVVNGELFFGQDRLEDAIAWAKQPWL